MRLQGPTTALNIPRVFPAVELRWSPKEKVDRRSPPIAGTIFGIVAYAMSVRQPCFWTSEFCTSLPGLSPEQAPQPASARRPALVRQRVLELITTKVPGWPEEDTSAFPDLIVCVPKNVQQLMEQGLGELSGAGTRGS